MNANEEISIGQSKVQLPPTMILDLNTDCLLKIFRYFEVEDMAIASDTCRRFREIACEAFKYEWKSATVWLNIDTEQNKLASTAILRNFGSQMQNIFIDFGEQWNGHFFEMIIERCSSSQLTEVCVSHKIMGQESIDRFKNKFTNLKSLSIEKISPDNNQPDCFDKHFPTIEQLRLFGQSFENQHVKQFISLNPQLKSLYLVYQTGDENGWSLLESINQHLPQLEQLELEWMQGFFNETDYQSKFLKNLKRLKFYNFGRGNNVQYLSISNENVEELEFQEGTCDSDVIDFICRYEKVKKLAIECIDYPLDYKDLLKLNKYLPKLTEFEISTSCCNINHHDIVQFVLDSKQLMTLKICDKKLNNIFGLMKDLQRKIETTKWTVDCNTSNNELIIRKYSNSGNSFQKG